jgi:hypothetical protein
MKNLNIKLLVCLLSVASTMSIVAVNKQQIRLSNHYGENVLVHINWKYGIASKPTDLILLTGRKDFLVKAPVSGYKLFSIDVTPAKNLASLAVSPIGYAAGGGIAYGVTHYMNHHTIRAHGKNKFIISKDKKKSQIASQRQIDIKGYTDEKYGNLNKNEETVVVDTDPETANSSDYQVVVDTDNDAAATA